MLASTVSAARATAARRRSAARSVVRRRAASSPDAVEHDAQALLLDEARERPVAQRQHRQPGGDVLERLVRQRRVEVRRVQRVVEAGPARVVARQHAHQRRRVERRAHAHAAQRAVGRDLPRRIDVEPDALLRDLREDGVQVVVPAAVRQRPLVDDPRQVTAAPLGRRELRRQVAGERVVGEHARAHGHLVARRDLGQQHVGHGDQARAALDGAPLQLAGVAGVGEAVLVRRAAQAVHVVHVVDHRHVGVLERQHGQEVGQVVRVDQVRAELRHHAPQVAGEVGPDPPPAIEQLVAGAVELRQRAAAAGEAQRQPGARGAEPHGVLERPDAGLLVQEEDAHQRRDRIGLAGLPTATENGSRSRVTTLPAPTTQPSPICTPGRITQPMPTHELRPIRTGGDSDQP